MTGITHVAVGAFFGALAGHAIGQPEAGLAVGALAALLPDIDTAGSIVGRRVRPVSMSLEALAGHRTVCHTVWFCLLVAAGFAALGLWGAGLPYRALWFRLLAAAASAVLGLRYARFLRRAPWLLRAPAGGGFAALGYWAAGLLQGASALWAFPALAGALSHLAADAATKTGVEPFAPLPLPGRLAFLAHPRGPIRTGTWWQEVPAMLAFLALALAALRL